MTYLLDTHALLFYLLGEPSLSPKVADLIDGPSKVCISPINLMEIAIKSSLGKLELVSGFDVLNEGIKANHFEQVQISFKDISTFHSLPWHHKDPFDRMLIAQALSREFTLITKDKFIHQYPVKTLW